MPSLLLRPPENAVALFRAWAVLPAFSGALFALKYGTRAGVSPAAALAGYLVFFAAHLLAALWLSRRAGNDPRARAAVFLGSLCYAAALLAVYLRVDPAALHIDRWSALDQFWNALARGEHPYRARTHLDSFISGFPGLFLIALPFWLLGDVGLLQFAAFAAFALLARRVLRGSPAAFVLLLLAGLPVFVYEVIVRSDLFSNMVLVAWLLHAGDRPGAFRGGRLWIAAVAWGLLLSTRGVVIVPLALAAFSLLRGRGRRDAIRFGAGVATVFAAALVPFYAWDPAFFLARNPYFAQSGYIPGWALAAVLLVSLWTGFRHRAAPSLFAAAGGILFGTVLGCWLLAAVQHGWARALWGNGFDISYFALPLPFLLLHLGRLYPAPDRSRAG